MTDTDHIGHLSGGMSLTNRMAFVTGAGSGIGRAGTVGLARCDAHVVVTDRDRDTAAETAAMVTSEGHSAEAHGLDVTVDEAVQRA
ncbi:MAG: SDR family NAD(P)-dependent oxidoreductase, partial [Pseudomonadota bacterium]